MPLHQWILIGATCLTTGGVFLLGLRKAVFWLLLLATGYAVGDLYSLLPKIDGMEWVPPSFAAMLCYVALCVAIYAMATRRWEVYLYVLVALLAVVNIDYAWCSILGWPPLPPHTVYVALTEALTYAVLALIWATAITKRLGAVYDASIVGHRFVSGVLRARELLQRRHQPSRPLRNSRH